MKKLFTEYNEEATKYELGDESLDFYYIADDANFKEKATIKDYYRIVLVNNTEDLNVDDLNINLEYLLDKGQIDFAYDEYQDVIDALNNEYSLNLELEESMYYDDLNYFKNGNIVYDKEHNIFDLAENWDEVVTTYLYKEEHGFIAHMQIEIQDYDIESSNEEVHILELDETEEVEVESNDDEENASIDNENQDEDENEDNENFSALEEITVMQKILIESTYIKKIKDDKYLIVICSKVPGHIDMAAIATKKQLISYLNNESVFNIDKYLETIG